MTNEELSGLLARLRSGEMDALAAVYSDLHTPVLTVIYRIVRDWETAEDLAQDVFVRLWQSPPDERVKRPRAWIFAVAHNLALDALRVPGHDALPAELQDDDFADAACIRLDVEDALARLAPRDREIVTLHLNAGLRFREIAQAMDMPLGTVLWRYSRAIGRLRATLDGGAG